MATSIREIRRDNPWWAKLLLAIAVFLFVLEATGVVRDVGLAALNLTASSFLFSMNRTLGEMSSKLDRVGSTLDRMDSKLSPTDPRPRIRIPTRVNGEAHNPVP